MEKAEAILHHTLEILCLLTVEDFIVVKREADGNKCSYTLCAVETQDCALDSSAIHPDLSFHLLGNQDRNQKKILELANKIIRLLTCEVPLKCQDVAVYFSKDEWEYLEGHGEHYDYRRMGEARGEPLPMNHQDTDQRSPDLRRVKEEPDTGDFEECQPAVSIGYVPPYHMKSEPRSHSDEDTEDRIHTGDVMSSSLNLNESPQFLSSVISHISEEPDEAYETQFIALDNDQTINSEIIYQLTVTKKRSRKPKIGPCELCGKRFGNKASLARHLKMHSGERPFSCDTCGKRFSCRNHVVTHQRIHTGERPYSCEECGRRFTNHNHLVLHKVVHTKEKPYSCPVCGKGFTRQSSVVKHSGMHAERKPHVCKECGKSYCQYANLVVHQRLHSGEKPFTCKHCEKGFICKATMLRHELTHTGERPFPCPQCDKCFADNSTLNKHKRKVHAKESKKS
ncbi:hypothetical protein GDO78_019813 [Eleutherodactylus coqui]|uniref:C2H2-type domain-containing protein n=4 Tax=Eleutherodactylus coqui TaxID=57060 RepID=A0A8J6JY08_ELECQ|nr:hypothetical protein GDO78_019813 [Eleutherodactylus coqui]KAG9472357.1 hypothetical protein GDO78_019813 [Eleutherodactylus coqui]